MNFKDQYQDIKKFQLPSGFRGRSAIIVQLWWIIENTFIAWSPQFLYGWRRFIYRLFGATIGKKVLIRPSVRCTYPWKLKVGDHSWIGDQVVIYSLGEITIGKNVVISQKTYLCTGSHDYRKTTFDIYSEPISIKDEAWIASDVFVAPGVSIGKGTVVGVRSTVLNDLPDGKICYGNPAQIVKDRIEKID